jgi:DNA-binding NtrC family response regulator
MEDLPRLVDVTRPTGPPTSAYGLAPGLTVAEAEQQLIEVTLQHTGGNKTRAAELLGISLKTLHNKLNRAKDEDALTA